MFAKLEVIGENQGLVDVQVVLRDLVDVICGETDVNNLSSQVVTSNSYILTDHTTSPWIMWDDNTSNNIILRCLQTDSQTYKYISMESAGLPISAVYSMGIMTDWDNGAHTGNDVIAADFVYDHIGQRMDVDESIFYIYADEFMIIVMPVTYYNTYGSVNPSTYGCMGTLECSRINSSLAIGDKPNHFVGSSVAWGTGSLTSKEYQLTFATGRDYLGANVSPLKAFGGRISRGSWFWSTNKYITSVSMCPEEPNPTYPLYAAEHLIVGGGATQTPAFVNSGSFMGSVSDRCDIWALPDGSQDILSIMLFKGRKFIVMKSGYHTSTAGTAVGTRFMVPYG